MKLFLSALLLAALPAAFAQTAPDRSNIGVAGMQGPNGQPSPEQAARFQAHIQEQMQKNMDGLIQAGCPLFLRSATVAPTAHYQPVKSQSSAGSALDLRFRNLSSKAIRSASITAHVKVKTNVYALDAHPFQVHLTFSGATDLRRDIDQVAQITLPEHDYLFGVAWVSLDAVTFADGQTWSAPQQGNYCRTAPGQGIDWIEAK